MKKNEKIVFSYICKSSLGKAHIFSCKGLRRCISYILSYIYLPPPPPDLLLLPHPRRQVPRHLRAPAHGAPLRSPSLGGGRPAPPQTPRLAARYRPRFPPTPLHCPRAADGGAATGEVPSGNEL